MKSDDLFVIEGFPRTGSTSILRILDSHPNIDCCMEPFHPKRYGGEFNRLALQDASLTRAIAAINLRWNGLKHVWEPELGWPFMGQPSLNRELVEMASSVITIRRKNLLRQVVSNYVCRQLGFWVGTRDDFVGRLDKAYLEPLKVAEIEATLKAYGDATARTDELSLMSPRRKMLLIYEDIFDSDLDSEQQKNFCQSLFRFVGQQPLSDEAVEVECLKYFDKGRYKWFSDDIYRRIPGTQIIDAELGNDLTGRLFS